MFRVCSWWIFWLAPAQGPVPGPASGPAPGPRGLYQYYLQRYFWQEQNRLIGQYSRLSKSYWELSTHINNRHNSLCFHTPIKQLGQTCFLNIFRESWQHQRLLTWLTLFWIPLKIGKARLEHGVEIESYKILS